MSQPTPTKPGQLKIIQELEQALNKDIPNLEDDVEIVWPVVGYKTDRLSNIVELGLHRCGVEDKDLVSISNLTFLTVLHLDSNKISKIGNLKNLVSLEELHASHNEIKDLTGLDQFTNLEVLNLGYNHIDSIAILEYLTKLTSLEINDNKISDISFLKDLNNLTTLDLRYNKITDATPIKDLILKQKGGVGGPVLQVSSSISWGGGEVTLGDNPLTTPPMEIVTQGTEAFLRWFEKKGKVTSNDKSEIQQRQNGHILHLKNTKKDALGANNLVEVVAPLLDNLAPDLETMFGVFGPWGRGKTFFVKELIKELKESNVIKHEYIALNYHAWKYQNTPANWAYLYQVLLEGYLDYKTGKDESSPYRDWFKEQEAIIDLNIARNYPRASDNFKNKITFAIKLWQTPLWKKLLGLARAIILFAVVGSIFNLVYENVRWFQDAWLEVTQFLADIWQMSGLLGFFTAFSKTPFVQFLVYPLTFVGVFGYPVWNIISTKNNLIKASSTAQELIKKFGTLETFQDKLGVQAEIDKEIETLLKFWLPEIKEKQAVNLESKLTKILLFVDDLDRCNEDGLVELIDSLRVMLEQEEIRKRVQVIVAVDEDILELAINLKYKKIEEKEPKEKTNNKTRNFALEYFDKLFLLGVRLSELSLEARQAYQEEITKEDRKINEEEVKSEALKIKNKNSSDPQKTDKPTQKNKTNQQSSLNQGRLVSPISPNSPKPSPQDILAQSHLTAQELEALRTTLKQISINSKVHLTLRQQLVFNYRYRILTILLDRTDSNYDRESKEQTEELCKQLWQKTCEKRGWECKENTQDQTVEVPDAILDTVVPY